MVNYNLNRGKVSQDKRDFSLTLEVKYLEYSKTVRLVENLKGHRHLILVSSNKKRSKSNRRIMMMMTVMMKFIKRSINNIRTMTKIKISWMTSKLTKKVTTFKICVIILTTMVWRYNYPDSTFKMQNSTPRNKEENLPIVFRSSSMCCLQCLNKTFTLTL